ncbi:MAG: pilus assembly protein TadG-related protein [Terracidiphilus sp.]
MSEKSESFLVQILKGESGQILPWMALMIVLFLGMAGLTLDLGHAYVCYRTLQASTDAAALAGAYEMGVKTSTASDVSTYVTNYSSKSGGANANPNLPSSTVNLTPTMGCEAFATAQGTPCIYVGGNNAIRVVQTATVPTMFVQALSLFGITSAKSITLSATAIAAVKGAAPAQYNVAMVVDTTNSMSSTDSDPACGKTRIYCALEGVQTMLTLLQPCQKGTSGSSCPAFDHVSLFTFPPVTANTVQYDTQCNAANPTITPYTTPTYSASGYSPGGGNNGTYQIIDYTNTWSQTGQPGGALNPNDPLTIATGGGTSTKNNPCPGLETPGGDGTYYAGAIYAAASSLIAEQAQNPNSVNALIILSDGDANAGQSKITGSTDNGATYGSDQDQCAQAIAAAQFAASLPNTTVYTIAYGSPSSGCSTDVKSKSNPTGTNVSPCSTMQQMSSGWDPTGSASPDYTHFFTDTTAAGAGACPAPTYSTLSLNQIFTALTYSLGRARLIPNNIPWT